MLDVIKKYKGFLYKKFFLKTPKIKSRAQQMIDVLSKDLEEFKIHFPKYSPIQMRKITKFRKPIIYPLVKPYSYAYIKWDDKQGGYIYHVIEPRLTEDEKNILERLKQGLLQTIDVPLEHIKNKSELNNFLQTKIEEVSKQLGIKFTDVLKRKILYYIFRDFVGYNEIDPLLQDSYIEDISCDGIAIPIFVVHKILGSVKTDILFEDEEKLKDFVIKLAERCNRYISYAEPLLDGALEDGSRVQATLASDVTTKGPTFTIRKFPEKPFTPIDIIKLKTADAKILSYLWLCLDYGANILIAGGTATGKTTFLNAISLLINPDAKIVSIEDTRELSLPHENWIPAVSRAGFVMGVGEVTLFDLLKESFRQNPDYLIVGEVRGEEASIMFQAMASGHTALSTMHAGSVEDVIKRLTTQPINLPESLVGLLDIVIIMARTPEKGESARRIKEIIEILPNLSTHTIVKWNIKKDRFTFKSSKLLNNFAQEHGISTTKIKKELLKREKILKSLIRKTIDWKKFARLVGIYSKNPSGVKKYVK